MFTNVHYDTRSNQIHLWEQIKGEKLYSRIDWVPYVFVPSDRTTNTKTIFGDYAVRKRFNNYYEYLKFQKENTNIYENRVKPEIQFLVGRYYEIKDEDIQKPEIKTFILDIEVNATEGFPSPEDAKDEITVVSLYNTINDTVYVFGLHPYQPVSDEIPDDITIKYFQCDNEVTLIKKMCDFIHKEHPDVISGWNIIPSYKMNISGFDLPYIINRCTVLFGEEEGKKIYSRLSPINNVKVYKKNEETNINIAGVSILDYMAMYKFYTRKNPESYSLDYITRMELGVGKLDYDGTLSELYNNDWNRYVDYNIIDTYRIKQLEDKLGYIKLVQSLSLMTKCPMQAFQAVTQLIEGACLTYYRRHGLCAPYFKGGQQVPFPAAYVKEPDAGLYKWIASIDISSSYPSHMIVLNMGVETYIGKIISFNNDTIMEYTKQRKFPEFELHNWNTNEKKMIEGEKLDRFNLMLERGLICVSYDGVCYKTNPVSSISDIQRKYFMYRKSVKNKMKKEKNKEITGQLNTEQTAIKTLINSLYGAISVPYSRLFNLHIAASIPACGKHTILMGEKHINEILNNPNENLLSIVKELQ